MKQSKQTVQKAPKGQAKKGNMQGRELGKTASPIGQQIVARTRGPRMEPTTSGGVRIRNTEVLQQISTSSGVTNGGYTAFGPGQGSRWIDGIAKNYGMYRVHKLEYAWVPNVPTTVGGEISFGVFYDYDDAVAYNSAVSDITLSQCEEYVSGPVYAGTPLSSSGSSRATNFGLIADSKSVHRRYNWLIVDPSATSGTANQSTAAWLGLAWNVAYTGVAGKIVITYDVEFIKPMAPSLNV